MATNQKAEPRRTGRPKSAEPSASVCTWVRASDHDRLIRLANQRETSVSALVREILVRRLTPDR